MASGPPWREDEAKQIESSHKDARCLLEPHPRGAGKRRKDQDIRGYHNTREDDLMALKIENEGWWQFLDSESASGLALNFASSHPSALGHEKRSQSSA